MFDCIKFPSPIKCVKLKPMQLYCYFYLLLLNKILWKQILFMFFQVLLTANIKSLNSYKKFLSHWILYVPIACFDWKKKWEKKILNFFFWHWKSCVIPKLVALFLWTFSEGSFQDWSILKLEKYSCIHILNVASPLPSYM